MKPRLRFKDHVWSCSVVRWGLLGFPVLVIGYGYTPAEAYCDWAKEFSPQMKE